MSSPLDSVHQDLVGGQNIVLEDCKCAGEHPEQSSEVYPTVTPSLQVNSNEILCICCIADFVDFGGKSWNFGQSGAVSSARGCCRRRNRQETHRRSPSEPYAPFRDVRGPPEPILSPEIPDLPKFAHFELLIAEGTVALSSI